MIDYQIDIRVFQFIKAKDKRDAELKALKLRHKLSKLVGNEFFVWNSKSTRIKKNEKELRLLQ